MTLQRCIPTCFVIFKKIISFKQHQLVVCVYIYIKSVNLSFPANIIKQLIEVSLLWIQILNRDFFLFFFILSWESETHWGQKHLKLRMTANLESKSLLSDGTVKKPEVNPFKLCSQAADSQFPQLNIILEHTCYSIINYFLSLVLFHPLLIYSRNKMHHWTVCGILQTQDILELRQGQEKTVKLHFICIDKIGKRKSVFRDTNSLFADKIVI